jgi:hypothetical protein
LPLFVSRDEAILANGNQGCSLFGPGHIHFAQKFYSRLFTCYSRTLCSFRFTFSRYSISTDIRPNPYFSIQWCATSRCPPRCVKRIPKICTISMARLKRHEPHDNDHMCAVLPCCASVVPWLWLLGLLVSRLKETANVDGCCTVDRQSPS